MASSARIDELRKKFDENPRRYFAPLANEYRKAGDLEQAIVICQEFLPQQPGHMSGHIVYGQALFELNRHDEAKTVFETALSLDPENLIALRHLGDIARHAGDTDSARIWYQRVLEADPRNEEIAQIMLELLNAGGAAAASAAPARATPAVDHSAPTPLSTPAVSTLAADLEADLSQPADAATGGESVPPSLEVEKATDSAMEFSAEFSAPVAASPAPSVSPPPPPPVAAADATGDDEGLLDLDSFDLGGVPLSKMRSSKPVPMPVEAETMAESEPEAQSKSVSDDTLSFEAFGESSSPPQDASPSEPEEPFEADPFAIAAAPPQPKIELATDMALGLPDDSPPPAVEAETPPGLETFEAGKLAHTPPIGTAAIETESFFDLPTSAPEPVAEPQAEAPEPEPVAPFVTETMATLYLEQGHLESAIEIYQQLIAQRPDDANLRERLRAVEERLHGPAPTPEVHREESAPSVVEETAPAAQPAAYGGPTIRDFLSGLAARRTPISVQEIPPNMEQAESMPELSERSEPEPEPAPPPMPERRPTPSSVETVGGSLGALFSSADATASDTAAASALAEAFQPEGPGTVPLQGVPAHRASSELSLDHVFKSGGPQRREEGGDEFSFDQFFAEEASESAAAPDASAAPPSEGGDDIAQFNAWLNGLKKS